MIITGMPIFCYFPFFRYFWPYFIFLFLNFLSLYVFIFCETARTPRFTVIFAKVKWHPCNDVIGHFENTVDLYEPRKLKAETNKGVL